MTNQVIKKDVIRILKCTTNVCRRLVWLTNSDPCAFLASDVLQPMKDALITIINFPNSTALFCEKMKLNYERALKNNWIGIGAVPESSRRGRRTLKFGLEFAQSYAVKHQKYFYKKLDKLKNESISPTTITDLNMFFDLTNMFIDILDWDEFVVQNPRGQVTNLVLEITELLIAIELKSNTAEINEEIGDVFFNLVAACLSLGINYSDIITDV